MSAPSDADADADAVAGDDPGEGARAAGDPLGPELPPRVRPSTAMLGALGVLVLAVLALGTLWLQARSQADDSDAALDEQRAIRLVAAQFAEAYFTFDPAAPQVSEDAVLALVTDEYASEITENRIPGLTEFFTDTSFNTVGTADTVLSTEVADSAAKSVVIVDVVLTSELAGRIFDGVPLVLQLREQGGEWRVDDVQVALPRVLDQDGQPLEPAASASTTATTSATTPG